MKMPILETIAKIDYIEAKIANMQNNKHLRNRKELVDLEKQLDAHFKFLLTEVRMLVKQRQ